MSIERHRCVQLPCPECGMDFKAWADAERVGTSKGAVSWWLRGEVG